MQNLLNFPKVLKEQNFLSEIDSKKIDILLNKRWLFDQQTTKDTLRKIEQAQEFYDSQIDEQIDFKSDRINFSQEQKVSSTKNEYNSAELFILDLQRKLNDLEGDKAENEYFVMYVTFNSIMMEVKICEADSLNQIKFIGEINGLETIAIVKTSDFNYLFVKHEQENSELKQKIGFIIDREIHDI